MRKAVIIGIDNYQNGFQLHGCCNDADNIAELLQKNENRDPNFEIAKYLNVLSRNQLEQYIEKCFSGEADEALFFFAGHGSEKGELVTANGDKFSFSDILRTVNTSKCSNKIIILDCCFSGNMGSLSEIASDACAIKEGVTILAACRQNECSQESCGAGVFTSLLCEALNGAAADVLGNVTPGGVYAYIDRALGAFDQRPVFKTNVHKFTYLRKVNPQVDIQIIRKIPEFFKFPEVPFILDPSYEKTNTPEDLPELKEPYAVPAHVEIMKALQQLESIGLVRPDGADHMYFAAMNSQYCKLTAIGRYYWRLAKEGKI